MTHPAPITSVGCATAHHPTVRSSAPYGLLLLTLALTSPLSAQVIPTGTPAADILLSQALTEHRVFLTCSALDSATHQTIVGDWLRDVDAAAAILTDQKVPVEAVGAFVNAADPLALMPADDAPWFQARDLCANQPDWPQRYDRGDFIHLDLTLPEAFK